MPVPILIACLLSGCAYAPRAVAPDSEQAPVEALTAEVADCRRQLDETQQRAARLQQENDQQARTVQRLAAEKDAALHSPGYEVALRLVYRALQGGDISVLQQLIPTGQAIDAGIQEGERDTYKTFDSAASLDFRPFVEWARQHPVDQGSFSVIASMPGYAWAVVTFPDGKHLRLFFDGWHVTKILASDRPIAMS